MGEIEPRLACEALDVDPGELADVLRLHGARLLRHAAEALENGISDERVDDSIASARTWLDKADALEFAWVLEHPEDDEKSDDARSADTEATPRRADLAVVAEQEFTGSEGA